MLIDTAARADLAKLIVISRYFRCKIPEGDVESFNATLCKHVNEVYFDSSVNNAKGKTENGSSFHFTEMFQDDATA